MAKLDTRKFVRGVTECSSSRRNAVFEATYGSVLICYKLNFYSDDSTTTSLIWVIIPCNVMMKCEYVVL